MVPICVEKSLKLPLLTFKCDLKVMIVAKSEILIIYLGPIVCYVN